MRLEELSGDATHRLLDFVETHLTSVHPAFREDVLHAIKIATPLRERTYLIHIAADLSGVDRAILEPFAFAAELLMASALTADDVIDGSFQRSGEPTLQAKANPSKAFLVAEYLHNIGHIALCERVLAVEEDIWSKAANEFRQAFKDLLLHQYLQSSMEGDTSVSHEYVDTLARGRTGKLIEACFAVPAIVSRSLSVENSLRECGRWFGVALQHRDDVLDFIATSEIIGKPVLLDLFLGQPNIVLSHALTLAGNPATRSTVLKYFRTTHTEKYSTRQIAEIQRDILSALRRSESFTFASKVIHEYCHRAKNAISNLPASRAKGELLDMIEVTAHIEFPWEDT